MSEPARRWHHRPEHIFQPATMYMVTGATLHKAPHFASDQRLQYLHDTLLTVLCDYGWLAQAWAVFPNHYHFIARSPAEGKDIGVLCQRLHSETARHANNRDGAPGRQVWFQYWDSCLTFERSWLARLKYVHNNAVKHRLVAHPEDYPWCSAAWFRQNGEPRFVRTVESFGTDRLMLEDDF